MKEYKEGSIVIMKKKHPCGENKWEVIRTGIDVKLKCIKCSRIVMLNRIDFDKNLKKVVE